MRNIFGDPSIGGINVEIKIDYKIAHDNTFKMFYGTVIELLRQLQMLTHREFGIYSDSNSAVKLVYCCEHHDIDHFYLDTITPADMEVWYLDLPGHNDIPDDERYSYDEYQTLLLPKSKVRDQKLYYSPEIPQLGYSKKRVDALEPGDFLYARKNGELTLDWHNEDQENIPIAQYILTENKLLRFMSLNYMQNENPRYGVARYPDSLPYGNWKFRFKCFADLKGRNREEPSYADGLILTRQLVDEINADSRADVFNSPTFVTRNCGYHTSPRLMTTLQYRTLGTRAGQWYVPTYVELMHLFEGYYDGSHQLDGVKFQIAENRKFLDLPELQFPLGTILEISDTECIAIEENGTYGMDYTKDEDCGTVSVAFLAVKP